MPATTWMKVTRFEPRQWILANGEVVTEPELEQTSSGRKIRVAGTTNSVFMNQLDDILKQAVIALAESKGTTVLSAVSHTMEKNAIGEFASQAKLHLLTPADSYGKDTSLYWRFRDPQTSYEVTLFARLTTLRGNQYDLNVGLWQPLLDYRTYAPSWALSQDKQFSSLHSLLLTGHDWDTNLDAAWRTFLRDEKPGWNTEVLGTERIHASRRAVRRLLEVVREFESLDTINVPDPADPFTPAWRSMELVESNVNGQFVSDLTEYLDTAPTVRQVAEMYETMVKTMESLGMTVTSKGDNDFMTALLNGDKGAMHLDVGQADEQGFTKDRYHKVSIHMPSGTIVVECQHHNVDMNNVAEQWDEAQTIAKLTGTTAELAAFGERAVKEEAKLRTRRIIKERK